MFATIDQLKGALATGARANLFRVDVTFPSTVITDANSTSGLLTQQMSLLCKSAAVPGFTVGVIEVPFRAGRRIKIPGDRTFADWSVTVINDENHTVRSAFNAWVDYISTSDYDSTSKAKGGVAQDYYSTVLVSHLNAAGAVVRKYQLEMAYPTDVGALDLSYDSTDTISDFTVNFQYHYLHSGSGSATFSDKYEE
jgi:hypothetical protein